MDMNSRFMVLPYFTSNPILSTGLICLPGKPKNLPSLKWTYMGAINHPKLVV